MTVPVLSDLVGDLAEFRAALRRGAPEIFRPVAFRPPVTLSDVDDLLTTGTLRAPYVAMSRGDRSIPPEAYCVPRTIGPDVHPDFVDGGGVRDLVRDGGSLLLRRLDQWHRPTAEVAAKLSAGLGRGVEASFTVTPPDAPGPGPRREDADVFVVPLDGDRRWRVHPAPADGDWGPGPAGDPGPALLAATLRPGAALFVPRGCAYDLSAGRGLSAHLTLSVREVGGAQLRDALERALLDGFLVEPRPLGEHALVDQAAGMLAHLAQRLAALSPQEIVARARTAMLADMPAHVSPGLTELAALSRPGWLGEAEAA